jgi:hypothetical protein
MHCTWCIRSCAGQLALLMACPGQRLRQRRRSMLPRPAAGHARICHITRHVPGLFCAGSSFATLISELTASGASFDELRDTAAGGGGAGGPGAAWDGQGAPSLSCSMPLRSSSTALSMVRGPLLAVPGVEPQTAGRSGFLGWPRKSPPEASPRGLRSSGALFA